MPEFVDLQDGDIVFNHLQTRELLSKKNLVGRGKLVGKSYADGSLPSNLSPITGNDTVTAKLAQVLSTNVFPTLTGIENIVDKQTEQIRNAVQNISRNSASTVNMENNFNISGVTGEEVADKIDAKLHSAFFGLSMNAYQQSMRNR